MEFSQETPGSSHFTPAEDNQDTSNLDKRRKNPSRLNKNWLRGLAHGQTLLPVKFSVLSRNKSVQITVMSPLTHHILPLVPRLQKVRKKRGKTVEMGQGF
jgi:hypothetical protein